MTCPPISVPAGGLRRVRFPERKRTWKKSRFSDEQIIGFLNQVEGGVPVKDLCRKHGFSEATFYKWRSRLGGLDVSEARRLRELESENTKLKKLLA